MARLLLSGAPGFIGESGSYWLAYKGFRAFYTPEVGGWPMVNELSQFAAAQRGVVITGSQWARR